MRSQPARRRSMRTTLQHSLESYPTTFTELKTEQLRAKTLKVLEPTPVAPAPCDLAFYLVSMEKSVGTKNQKWRRLKKSRPVEIFTRGKSS